MFTIHPADRPSRANDTSGATLPLSILTAWRTPLDPEAPLNLAAIAMRVLRETPGFREHLTPYALRCSLWSDAGTDDPLRARLKRESAELGLTVEYADGADDDADIIVARSQAVAGELSGDASGNTIAYIATESVPLSVTFLWTFARTRLMIWHLIAPAGATIEQHRVEQALAAAQRVVESGGPPTIVLRSASHAAGERYMTELMARIFGNHPLSDVGASSARLDRTVAVDLFAGAGTEDILQFDRLIEAVTANTMTLTADARRAAAAAAQARAYATRFLHERDAKNLLLDVDEGLQRVGTAASIRRDMHLLPLRASSRQPAVFTSIARNVLRESTLRSLMETEPGAGAEVPGPVTIPNVREAVDRLARSAPRVLNAAVATGNAERVLEGHEALHPETQYALLIDVGPKWDKTPSITQGSEAFPESAIPEDGQDGHVLDVVLIGEQLSPPIVAEQIWLPARTGRSSPITCDERGEPGPVRIVFSTPPLHGASAMRLAARVSIYLGAELLQSGVLRLTAAGEGSHELTHNALQLDFVLTPDMADLAALGTRQLRSAADDDERSAPVTASVTLNDDGFTGHRLMFKLDGKETFASLRYDPDAAKALIDTVRDELINTFLARRADGTVPVRAVSLGPSNERTPQQFRGDLRMLALAGADIHDSMMPNVVPDGRITLDTWRTAFRAAMTPGAVFRIARAGPVGYVLPWTAVYDIPIVSRDNPKLPFCAVLDEWDRGAEIEDACPHWDEANHREDMLCPYGFWGLRTVIEQPLSRDEHLGVPGGRPDVFRAIAFDGDATLSMARTSDARLGTEAIKAHVDALRTIFAFSPDPEVNTKARTFGMLETSKLVYFLCHGERDAKLRDVYLGIGPKDADPEHRVYAKALSALSTRWIDQKLESRHPLVFINGCHTSDLSPGDIVNFVDAFRLLGASGLIGTEVSVQLQVAREVAETLLSAIARGATVGSAMRELRWRLVRKRNLIGLAYVLYGFSDLHLVATLTGAPRPAESDALATA